MPEVFHIYNGKTKKCLMLPDTLRSQLTLDVGCTVLEVVPVAGGDISKAFRIRCSTGRRVFMKYSSEPEASDIFRAESIGLALLGASRVIDVPKVLKHGSDGAGNAYILQEFVERGKPTPLFWDQFGMAMANLHGNTSAFFGFSHDNYIGRLKQSNQRLNSWPEFYAAQRLIPQMERAVQSGAMNQADARLLEGLCRRLENLCPQEPPALIHGDLWSGNFICDTGGRPVLVDPSASFSHREMDLAMARLFGGFHQRFFESYADNWPLEPGFDERINVYQLYYLLVHVNHFGGSYIQDARAVLKKWG